MEIQNGDLQSVLTVATGGCWLWYEDLPALVDTMSWQNEPILPRNSQGSQKKNLLTLPDYAVKVMLLLQCCLLCLMVRAETPSWLHPQDCRLGHQHGTSGSTIGCEAAALHSLRSCTKANNEEETLDRFKRCQNQRSTKQHRKKPKKHVKSYKTQKVHSSLEFTKLSHRSWIKQTHLQSWHVPPGSCSPSEYSQVRFRVGMMII